MNNYKVSRNLVYILRHTGQKFGLKFRDDGFIEVNELLKFHKFEGVTLEQIKEIVNTNDKKRFQLIEENNKWFIRAVQGHSINFKNINYKKITKNMIANNEIPMAVHGTYKKFLNSIKKNGLNKMKRTHIHFALGLATDKNVISGMRSSSEVLIYLNMEKCLEDGIELLLSENNVILTNGINGIIEPKYFKKIVDAKTGEKI